MICVRNGSKALIGKSALINEGGAGCFHGAFMTVFRSKIPSYCFQLIQSELFFREVSKNLGATINSINGSNLKKFPFNFPPSEEEISKVSEVLASADRETQIFQSSLVKLKEEKRALMQQLLTGKRRVTTKC